MSKYFTVRLARAAAFAALFLALLVPAAPSYAGCPVCAIVKTTTGGRAVPDDNDFTIFDMLDLRDSLVAQPFAAGFPTTTQAGVGFLMSSSYYSQTLSRVGGVDALDDLLGTSRFAVWGSGFGAIPMDLGGINTLFVLGSSFTLLSATDLNLMLAALANFAHPTSEVVTFGSPRQLVMNDNIFEVGVTAHTWGAQDRVVEVTIPEPASLALIGLGLVGIAVGRRR